MPKKPQKSARVEPDVARYIEHQAEQQNMSEAEVMRTLLRDGIRYQQTINELPDLLRQIDERLQALEEDDGRSLSLFGE